MAAFTKIQSGYSYAEILCCVALSAVLLTISIPRLGEFKNLGALKAESRLLKIILEDGLLKAQSENKKISLNITSSTLSLSEALKSPFFTHSLPKNYKFVFKTYPIKISFYPSGVDTPKTILVKNQKAQCKITISLRGRVSAIC